MVATSDVDVKVISRRMPKHCVEIDKAFPLYVIIRGTEFKVAGEKWEQGEMRNGNTSTEAEPVQAR